MGVVIECVDDGNGRVGGEAGNLLATLDASRNGIGHATEDSSRVLVALLDAEGAVSHHIGDGMSTEAGHAGLERNTGAEGGLLEQHE